MWGNFPTSYNYSDEMIAVMAVMMIMIGIVVLVLARTGLRAQVFVLKCSCLGVYDGIYPAG